MEYKLVLFNLPTPGPAPSLSVNGLDRRKWPLGIRKLVLHWSIIVGVPEELADAQAM